jgi:hypothetical protein
MESESLAAQVRLPESGCSGAGGLCEEALRCYGHASTWEGLGKDLRPLMMERSAVNWAWFSPKPEGRHEPQYMIASYRRGRQADDAAAQHSDARPLDARCTVHAC